MSSAMRLCAALAASLLSAACGNNDAAPGSCTTSPPSGGPEFVGTVDFSAARKSMSSEFGADLSVFPNFGSVATGGALCPGMQLGACCYVPQGSTCALPEEASAGTTTLTDGSTQLGQLVFSSGFYEAIDSSETPALAWQVGDTLSVSAHGAPAMAPAFSGSVVAPPDLTGLSPALSADTSTSLTVPKATDFKLTWTPGTGTAQVELIFEDITLAGITCSAPITAGSITVASALLEKLGSGGSLVLGTVNQASATSSNAAITVRAEGTPLFGDVTYQ